MAALSDDDLYGLYLSLSSFAAILGSTSTSASKLTLETLNSSSEEFTSVCNLQKLDRTASCNREEEPYSGARINSYVKDVVTRYNAWEFRTHFRMTPTAFEALRKLLGPLMLTLNNTGHSITEKIMMFLWTLGNQESFRQIGDRFGVHRSSAHFIFIRICNILSANSNIFLRWPSVTERAITEVKFQQRAGLPGVIGCIDGCHIPIEAPPNEDGDAYYNRKKLFSVILQGTRDHKKRFTDVNVGRPGSCHDAFVFKMSPIGRELKNILPPEKHLLGDSAYPLKVNLLTPYRDNGHLSQSQRNFNYAHSATRSKIEECFGFLKSKFRRLKHLYMQNLKELPGVVMAACCVHNHVINEDYAEDDEDDDIFESNVEEERENIYFNGEPVNDSQAEQKREHIQCMLETL